MGVTMIHTHGMLQVVWWDTNAMDTYDGCLIMFGGQILETEMAPIGRDMKRLLQIQKLTNLYLAT